MSNAITVQNIRNLEQLAQVKYGWITGIVWSPDGATLAIAGATGVRVYVGQFGGQPTHALSGQEGHVKCVALSPDGRLLASGASDMTVKIWDMTANGEDVATLTQHTDSVDAVAFSPDNKTLATAGADGTIILWNVADGTARATLTGHEKEVSTLAFAVDGNLLLSGSWDNTIHLWDTGAETEGTIFGTHQDWVRGLAVSPSGTMLASASKDGSVALWDIYEPGHTYARVNGHINGADAVAFSPDGALIATGGRDNVVRIWSVHRLLADQQATIEDALITMHGHEKPVMSLAFNAAGTLLASGSGDNTVRLWHVP